MSEHSAEGYAHVWESLVGVLPIVQAQYGSSWPLHHSIHQRIVLRA